MAIIILLINFGTAVTAFYSIFVNNNFGYPALITGYIPSRDAILLQHTSITPAWPRFPWASAVILSFFKA
ncbi:hypothetical protein ROZALSC1DRAFT_31334 [Rozella allomycis CSF55]|uniref:Uncharacterized protein n=1 Tax=Rozella allomycis (strain CSF55) TaxID=988480 RepID=A0A075B1W6_ROZAC|nr:hypothetical protein O9G_004019 [Rozella allomycis CSF55]RKP16808.1 hypothetical protein ROZALSC1DRAFT_31334 [Rozella allomycis CSF55]|eukprot:EPZ36360.1 hypothetical protein O9G_004019 [Rozella allomycis CSF55]